jgi:2,4-dienoyl-CoA reductase-like NADH-dependent reductase (Old Yellow Enzyme family)
VQLFTPTRLGQIELANRIVMAPLTRMRSGESGVPNDLNVEHYAQRAGLGLIVTEGTFLSAESRGFAGQPGIVTEEQQEGWRRVADAVHERGGRIVMQLMHAGRVSHPAITGTGRIVAPSAIAIQGEVHTPAGKLPFPVPHALTEEELGGVRDQFVAGARRAIAAGLDGVEVHSANGYLLHEFLSPASNVRTDGWGGSPERRARFAIEVTEAAADAVGSGRVGIRISPAHNIQDVLETDADETRATYLHLVDGLAPLGLSYLSVLHREPSGAFVQELRERFAGPLVANTGFASPTEREEAAALVKTAEAVAIGRAAIANPDLVERWRDALPENDADSSTFYTPGAKGYTDYPRLSA